MIPTVLIGNPIMFDYDNGLGRMLEMEISIPNNNPPMIHNTVSAAYFILISSII